MRGLGGVDTTSNPSEQAAYPELPSYEARATQRFTIGAPVRVGPGYRMGGRYEHDGVEGDWFVVGKCPPGDYKIAKHPQADYAYIITAARLVPRTHSQGTD